MRIGALRNRMTLQQPLVSANTGGSYEESAAVWMDVAQIWAGITLISSRTVQANAEAATHEIVARWRPDFANGQRLVLDNKYYLVRAVLRDDTNNVFARLLVDENLNM